ncbi:unnamed protein product, partial [Mesorhabditis spiculigera]
MALAINIIFIFVAGSAAAPEKNFIVKGWARETDIHRYMVSIQSEPGMHRCGGSIIADDWVLTAASCVAADPITPYDTSKYTIIAGTPWINDTKNHPGPTEQRLAVAKVYIHKKWKPSGIDDNIALIKLRGKFSWDKHVNPVMLWRARMPARIAVNILGWGIAWANGEDEYQPRLRGYIAQMLPRGQCKIGKEGERTQCFDGGQKSSSPCRGDTGGPITTYAPAVNKAWYYVQVSLIGRLRDEDCQTPDTTIQGPEIALYCDWIHATTGEKLCLEL